MKAMILAAGLGSRLKPLTNTIPKPLVEVAGKPLIEHTILRLKQAGITEIVCNVCPFKEKIKAYLQAGQKWGVNISYSEEDTPLETGGGILKALPLLGAGPFVLVSGDIYVDYDFASFEAKLNHNLIHLVMVKNPQFNPKGDYELEAGRILLHENPRYTYASFGVIHSDLLKAAKHGVFSVVPFFKEAILNNRASGELFEGTWHNIGTIHELNLLKAALKNG